MWIILIFALLVASIADANLWGIIGTAMIAAGGIAWTRRSTR